MWNPNHPLDHCFTCDDPSLEHIPRQAFKQLYEPSDDTFLFMEAMEKDLNTMRALLPQKPLSLEMGCGTGILSAYFNRLVSTATPLTCINHAEHGRAPAPTADSGTTTTTSFAPFSYALDLNPIAVQTTQETFCVNKINGEVIQSDLLSAFPLNPHKHSIHVLLFNPPYVPSTQEELENSSHDMMLINAYAGGCRGREILDRFIPDIPRLLLNPGGLFYCVVLWPQNDLDDITYQLNKASNPSLTSDSFQSLLTSTIKQYIEGEDVPQTHQDHDANCDIVNGGDDRLLRPMSIHDDTNSSNSSSISLSNVVIPHLIHARQCGLEALCIVRFATVGTLLGLPPTLRTAHPVALDSYVKTLFRPKLTPAVKSIDAVDNVEGSGSNIPDNLTISIVDHSLTSTPVVDNDKNDSESDDSDTSNGSPNGFHLF